MSGFKIFTVLLSVICCSRGAIEVARKFYDYEEIFQGEYSFDEGNLVYAICEPDGRSVETATCKIVQEKYPYEEAAYSCLISLDYDERLEVAVMALGKDKAVLYWFNGVNIGTLDLKTCQMKTIGIPDSSVLLFMQLRHVNKFVPYSNDSYDIFFPDPHYHPEKADLFKIRIDGNGEMISEPRPVNIENGWYFKALTVATRSPSKGYAFVKRNQFKSKSDFDKYLKNPLMHLLLVKPDGMTRQLAEYYFNTNGAVAGGNDYISLCNKQEANGHVVCTQYDEHGNVVFTTTLATLADSRSDTDVVKSYNLPNGGMLVMYGTKVCTRQRAIGLKVVWIGTNGKIKGKLCTQQMEISKEKVRRPYLYANGDKGYCATVVIEDNPLVAQHRQSESFEVITNCFTEDDLLS